MNPVELKYYPFMISVNKWTGSGNVLSPKICFPKGRKDIYVKALNMITNKNEAKAMTEHISCDCKCNNSTTCISKQKWSNETCQCECKNYCKYKKDNSWNRSTCICENSKYLKSFADTSVMECDEIIIVMNTLSTKKTNTIAANVTSTASTNCHNKNVGVCYILLTVFLVIILLLIIIIICYYYAKQKGII